MVALFVLMVAMLSLLTRVTDRWWHDWQMIVERSSDVIDRWWWRDWLVWLTGMWLTGDDVIDRWWWRD